MILFLSSDTNGFINGNYMDAYTKFQRNNNNM